MGDVDVSSSMSSDSIRADHRQGASPKEQILEACRRDNTELFQEVFETMQSQPKDQIAVFFNNTQDTMGNYLLHVCANYGSCGFMNLDTRTRD